MKQPTLKTKDLQARKKFSKREEVRKLGASNDEILTVSEVKAELRIPPGMTSQDALLASQIASGIAFRFEGATGTP